MIRTYIALGSNLDQPQKQLQRAVASLNALPGSRVEQVSGVYRSAAVGPPGQPDYLNAVLLLCTSLPALELLDALQQIEHEQGRVREIRWGARTLDLDILLYGQQRIDAQRLTVPHPAMAERNFVLYPLAEIGGENLLLPDGKVLGTLVAACTRNGLAKTDTELELDPTVKCSARGAML